MAVVRPVAGKDAARRIRLMRLRAMAMRARGASERSAAPPAEMASQASHAIGPGAAEPASIPLGEVGPRAWENIGSSADQVAEDYSRIVTDPIGTLKGIGQMAVGGMQKLVGQDGDPGINPLGVRSMQGVSPFGDQRPVADAVGEYASDRFGGWENIKRTMANDPVGAGMDLVSLLTMGAGGIASLPGHVGRVGRVAANAANAVDPLSLAASGVGAAARKFGTKTPTKQFVAGAPSAEDLGQASGKLYDAADAAGVTFPQAEYGTFVKDVTAKLRAEGVDSVLHPKANRIVGILEETAGEAPDLQRLEILRKQFSDAAASTDAAERRLGVIGIEMVDDFVESGSGPVSGVLQEARNLWKRKRKSETISEAIENASLAKEGVEAGLRNQFSTLYRQRNKPKMRGFTSDEIAAIKAVAEGNMTANVLRRIGSLSGGTGSQRNMLLGVLGAGAGASLGGPGGGMIGAFAVPGAGHIAQRLAERGTRSRADLVRAMTATGSSPQSVTQPLAGAIGQAGLPPGVGGLGYQLQRGQAVGDPDDPRHSALVSAMGR